MAIGAGFELSSVLVKIAVALERGDKVKTLFPAGFDHPRTKIVTVEQNQDSQAFGRLEFANQFRFLRAARVESFW